MKIGNELAACKQSQWGDHLVLEQATTEHLKERGDAPKEVPEEQTPYECESRCSRGQHEATASHSAFARDDPRSEKYPIDRTGILRNEWYATGAVQPCGTHEKNTAAANM